MWALIELFRQQTAQSGVFDKRRRQQNRDWLHGMIEEHLRRYFFNHPEVQRSLPQIEQAVMEGDMPATAAAHELLKRLNLDG